MLLESRLPSRRAGLVNAVRLVVAMHVLWNLNHREFCAESKTNRTEHCSSQERPSKSRTGDQNHC